MSPQLVDRLTSRKFWAYIIGVSASVAYAANLIDQTGLAAIVAASAAYQVGEGLADFGQGRALVARAAQKDELDRLLEEV
jgi:hypothetical protein